MLLSKHVTTEALEVLDATLNFIDILIKLLKDNYYTRHVAYINTMKYMFKQMSITMIKSLTPKLKSPETYGKKNRGWYMEKRAKGIPPLRISTLS